MQKLEDPSLKTLAKTDAELKLLMQEAGVWHQDRGGNRAEILKRLSAPLPEEQKA